MRPSAAITIRRATQHDAPALTALMRASAAYQGDYASILADYAVTADQIARDHFYLAEDANGLVLGFYSLVTDPEDELDLMFVRDDVQGRGVGGLLIRDLCARAAQLGVREIRVVSHPPALGFYERQGAIRTGTWPPTPTARWERPILKLIVDERRR